MARAPEPGRTKTRLHPLLGPDGCARLQAALIRHTARLAAAVPAGAAFLCYLPADAAEAFGPLADAGITLFPQHGADLGRRMADAAAFTAARRDAPVVIIGTDCPVLDTGHLYRAAAHLRRGCDVVFGPARDGGYYLVALARPAPEVFDLPPAAWGGPDVLELSRTAADALGLTVGLIDTEDDLDTPADAATMLADPRLPPEIADLLRAAPAVSPT